MIRYIQPPNVASLTGADAALIQQIRRDFGLVGDIFKIHSLSPPLAASFWACLRETELAGAAVSRALKEAVATAVAVSNRCTFCVDAHGALLMATGDSEVARLLMNGGGIDGIRDDRTKSLVAWALAARSPDSSGLADPPFTSEEAPELIGTVVINHYINRMIDVLVVNKSVLPIRRPFLKQTAYRLIATLAAPMIRKKRSPGASMQFVPEPDAELPADFQWASRHPFISRAFASFAAVVEEGGNQALSQEARAVIRDEVQRWNGAEPGLSRAWVEGPISSLTGLSRAAARLGLLTAIAPYQIDDELVREVQVSYRDDVRFVQMLSWSAFQAARKIGTWINSEKEENKNGSITIPCIAPV